MHSAYIILISLWVFCYLFADISVQIVAKSQGFVVLIIPISPLLWSSRPLHKFSPPARKLKLADFSASFSLYFPHFMTTASINISMDQAQIFSGLCYLVFTDTVNGAILPLHPERKNKFTTYQLTKQLPVNQAIQRFVGHYKKSRAILNGIFIFK